MANMFSSQILRAKELVSIKELHELFLEMERRQYNVTRIKWMLGIIGFMFIYLSSQQIKSWLSHKSVEVAHKSIEDPELKQKVSTLSTEIGKEALDNLLINEELKKKMENYLEERLSKVLSSVEIELKAQNLSKNLLNNEELQREMGNTFRSSLYYGFIPSYFTSFNSNAYQGCEDYEDYQGYQGYHF